MYTEEMLESIKKVEAKRAENAAMEPRRMTAEEKGSGSERKPPGLSRRSVRRADCWSEQGRKGSEGTGKNAPV